MTTRSCEPDPVDFSILMPAYHEGHHIYANVRETRQAFLDLGRSFEIIVMDDGSNDGTFEESQRAAEEWTEVKAFRTEKNKGKGGALKESFRHAIGRYVAFLDSDLDIHPRQFKVLMDVMEKTGADAVIGCKRHPQSELHYPLPRKILSWGYFLLARLLFGLPVRDTQTGLKLFKREALDPVLPSVRVEHYAFDLELLVQLHQRGFRIAEAPVVVDFKGRFGRIRPKDILVMFYHTLDTFYRLRLSRKG